MGDCRLEPVQTAEEVWLSGTGLIRLSWYARRATPVRERAASSPRRCAT